MRLALPIFWCLNYDTQVKLAKMLNSIPPCVWKEWPALEVIDFKPIPISDKDKEYLKVRETERLMALAPSRSRG